jgi:hypothetical protein
MPSELNAMRTEKILNVPKDEAETVKADFNDAGATKVDTRDNDNGTWAVTATFPTGTGRTETIKNVPNDQVAQVKKDFEDAGATTVSVNDNGNGTSDVTATFND